MSSSPHRPQTILLSANFGQASGFDRNIFPLSSYKKRDSLGRSDYYLDATLDELLKITNIGANPEQLRKFVKTTKATYDQLILKKAELEKRPKTWNPLKIFANYRAVRLFVASSKFLYYQTKSRSDEIVRTIGRELLVSVPGDEVQHVEDEPSMDMDIVGIAVRLDRPLDDAASQQLINAANTIISYSGTFEGDEAASETSSILSDEYFMASESLISLPTIGAEEETPDVPTPPIPSSPTTITNNYYGCFYSMKSTIVGQTTQFGGRDNGGSIGHNIKTMSDMCPQSP